MSAPMFPTAGRAEELKGGLRAVSAVRDKIKAEAARAEEFRAIGEQAAAELCALKGAAAEREGAALADGEKLPTVTVAESRKRDRLEREGPANLAASKKLQDRIENELATSLRQAEAAAVSAALTLALDTRNGAVESLHPAFDALVHPIATMIAAQGLHDSFVRAPFDLPAGVEPGELWNGAIVARLFIGAIPARITPERFAERIETTAAELLRVALAELEGRA